MATTKAQRKLFFNLRSKKKQLGWLSHNEANAIADDLGVETRVVYEMEGRLSAYDAAFDASANDDDDRASQAPAYFLEDKSADPALLAEDDNFEKDSNDRLHQALTQLDERSRDILQRRWLTEDKATLHELAAAYGISAERIRQLEKNAMNKLKSLMADELVA